MNWKPWYPWLAWISLAIVSVGVFVEPQPPLVTATLFALLLLAVAILSWQDQRRSRKGE